ncbi:MAG: PilZ domain-containing protein [bacterium]
MNKNYTHERRRDERILLSKPLTLGVKSREPHSLISISYNGAKITCKEKPEWNTILHFTLSLPTGIHTISLSGRVIWANKLDIWHVGVEFVSMTEVDTLIISAYVDYLKHDKELTRIHNSINKNLDHFIQSLFMKE